MKFIRKNMEIFDKICYSQIERGGFFMMQETIMKDIYNRTNAQNDITKTKRKSEGKLSCFFESAYYLHKLKKATKDIDFKKYLEKKEGVCSGNYVLKETRIMPKVIYEYVTSHINEDKSLEIVLNDIEKDYPALNEEKILVALMYYFKKASLISLICEAFIR